MRVVRTLAWLPLLLVAWPVAGRALIPCPGPVSGPTAYCPDCIYDTYGESDPDKVLDDFACAQFSDVRGLGGGNSLQYADPFLVVGSAQLEGVMIRLSKGGVPGDAVVRVWDDFDPLGNDDPGDPGSFADNEPGTVLASVVIPQASILCQLGQPIHQASRCDVSTSFAETPLLEEGAVYWVGATMTTGITSVAWILATGRLPSPQPCAGVNCSEEWVFANSIGEEPPWNAATFSDPVGLVRLVPEPSTALLRGAALAMLPALAARRRTRRARSATVG